MLAVHIKTYITNNCSGQLLLLACTVATRNAQSETEGPVKSSCSKPKCKKADKIFQMKWLIHLPIFFDPVFSVAPSFTE